MFSLFHRLAGRRYHRLLLLPGLAACVWGIYELGGSAVFVHEAVCLPARVVDVRQCPFESRLDALRGGHYQAETAYFPIVRFTLPNGVDCPNRQLPDADADDYTIGEQIDIITMPLDPTTARRKAWKFIWGAPTVTFLGGLVLLLLARLLRGRKQRRPTHRSNTVAAPRKSETPRREARRPQQEQLDLGLELEPAPDTKPKRKRRKAAGSSSGSPRKRSKSSN